MKEARHITDESVEAKVRKMNSDVGQVRWGVGAMAEAMLFAPVNPMLALVYMLRMACFAPTATLSTIAVSAFAHSM